MEPAVLFITTDGESSVRVTSESLLSGKGSKTSRVALFRWYLYVARGNGVSVRYYDILSKRERTSTSFCGGLLTKHTYTDTHTHTGSRGLMTPITYDGSRSDTSSLYLGEGGQRTRRGSSLIHRQIILRIDYRHKDKSSCIYSSRTRFFYTVLYTDESVSDPGTLTCEH